MVAASQVADASAIPELNPRPLGLPPPPPPPPPPSSRPALFIEHVSGIRLGRRSGLDSGRLRHDFVNYNAASGSLARSLPVVFPPGALLPLPLPRRFVVPFSRRRHGRLPLRD